MNAWFDFAAPARWSGNDLSLALATLAVALGCGLLIGVERERRKGSGPGRALAGLRSFALTCVTGAAAALTGLSGVVVAGAAFVVGLGLLAYFKDRSDDPGITTEVALLLTYLIGVLSAFSLPLAAGLAVCLTALLAARERLHRFVRLWLTPAEMRDGTLLAALVLVALPLVPDRPLWGEALNPHLIVQLLALLLGVQALAHLARRLLAARHAVALSSLASGFVSSTATIATQGLAVRDGHGTARLMAAGGLLSCIPTQLQLLLVAAAVRPAWLSHLWLAVLVAVLVAAVWCMWMLRGVAAEPPAPQGPGPQADRMFSLKGALAIAALLTGIQAMVQALSLWLGEAGLIAGTLLGALADLHSALAAVFAYGPPEGSGAATLHWALVGALLVHAGSKTATAAFTGGLPYVRWLVPGLWVHTLAGVAVLVWAMP